MSESYAPVLLRNERPLGSLRLGTMGSFGSGSRMKNSGKPTRRHSSRINASVGCTGTSRTSVVFVSRSECAPSACVATKSLPSGPTLAS